MAYTEQTKTNGYKKQYFIDLKKYIYFAIKLNLLTNMKLQPFCAKSCQPIKKILVFIVPQHHLSLGKKLLKASFFSKTLSNIKATQDSLSNSSATFFFLNRFLLNFLENFLQKKLVFNLKKGSNNIILKQVGSRKFFFKYFKKNLKVSRRVVGILYYALLLKDSSIFVNFCSSVFEKSNIKLHKKILLGFKKLLKDVFKPIFNYLGVLGLFLNIKGKLGVSGSAKKRRYFFSYGKHSLTTRAVRFDSKLASV
jgi:hypothetical protein